MARTIVVTGAASGIGRATAALLRETGDRVIGVDLKDSDVAADLSTATGRLAMVDDVARLSGGTVDGLVVCAGTSARLPVTMAVNFFGAVATLEGLRPLLAKSEAPRAVVVTSYAATMPVDEALIDAALARNETHALALAEGKDVMIYTSSKAALAIWCREAAVSDDWAGANILLNMVAPGMVDTPMVSHRLHDPAAFAEFKKHLPTRLDRFAGPEEIAQLLVFLASPANSYLVGQHIFIDGGAEAYVRGPRRI